MSFRKSPKTTRSYANSTEYKQSIESHKPSQFSSNVTYGHTYRFISLSGNSTNVSAVNLIGACGGICTTSNTALSAITQSVKINRIQIWSPVPAIGSSVTVSLTWQGVSTSSGTKEVSDTSVSTSSPAYISTTPPRNSTVSFWHQFDSNSLFSIVAPIGSVIDVSLTSTLYDNNSAITNQFGISTGTVGQMYYLALDGSGANNYRPVSLNSTN